MLTRLPYALVAATIMIVFFGSCKTGVEPSPDPGLLRVIMKANENDTTIVIRGDTTQFSRWDVFDLYVAQARVYKGENYASVFVTPGVDRINADTVNIIAREWLDGTPITTADTAVITPRNSRYRKYVVFESYLPPGTYDNLQFGVTANEIRTFIPRIYQNPVQLPPGDQFAMDFPLTLNISEGKTTEIDIEVFPFRSLRRYRDAFQFDRDIKIVSVRAL